MAAVLTGTDVVVLLGVAVSAAEVGIGLGGEATVEASVIALWD